jgi:hypothetical protein
MACPYKLLVIKGYKMIDTEKGRVLDWLIASHLSRVHRSDDILSAMILEIGQSPLKRVGSVGTMIWSRLHRPPS